MPALITAESCSLFLFMQVGNFSEPEVPAYIAFVGILSVFAQVELVTMSLIRQTSRKSFSVGVKAYSGANRYVAKMEKFRTRD